MVSTCIELSLSFGSSPATLQVTLRLSLIAVIRSKSSFIQLDRFGEALFDG